MTLKKWNLLYKAYKSHYDLEYTLQYKNKRYSDLEKETTIDDVIPY